MATSMSAPQPLAFHTENTTAEPSSSNSRTISQFQHNSPYAIGIPTTTFTTTPPFSSHPTTITIRPRTKNTITLPTGCLHSTGPSSHTTSSLKPKVGNSPNIERIFTPDWPLTNVSFDDYDYANRPSENHTFTLPPNTTLSHSSATSPNIRQPPLKQQNNCAAAAIQTWKSTPSGAWPPILKNQAAAELSTSSTKPSFSAILHHPNQTSRSQCLSWRTTTSQNTANSGSAPPFSNTNIWPFGNLPNFLNRFHTLQPPTSTTISKPLFPPYYAPATSGASAKTSTSHMVWSTSKRKNSGRKAAPLSLTSTHSVATSYASPAVFLTSSSNTSTHSIQASFPSRNSGAISCYLTQTPADISLYATNDDLVGFFNSVPQHRLIDAVHSMIHHWQTQQCTHTLTVDVQATGNPFHHSHIGRHHQKHPTQRTIQTSDITTIVAYALDTCIFRACNNTYKQNRGAGIGSQLSPALCNVAITLIEHSWHQIHNNLLQHTDLHFTYYRYVDNRFIVHNEHFLHHPAIQTLIHHNFFGDPVELEPVDDFHLLGFNIDLQQRTITYIQPLQPWKIRDATSAGSHRLAL